jgi:phage terminase small subunit
MTIETTPASPVEAAQGAALSAEAESLKVRLEAAYDLSAEGAQAMLAAGLRAFDLMRQADALVAKNGVVVLDRYGTPKANPAVDIARQARAQWMGALRVLGLTGWSNDE